MSNPLRIHYQTKAYAFVVASDGLKPEYQLLPSFSRGYKPSFNPISGLALDVPDQLLLTSTTITTWLCSNHTNHEEHREPHEMIKGQNLFIT